MDNTDAIIKDLHADAAMLLKDNNSDEVVIDHLMQKGIHRHYAELVLENAKSDASDRIGFYNMLIGGASFTIGGVICTIMGYQHPLPGGMYFIFYGVIVSGISLLVRAFILFRK